MLLSCQGCGSPIITISARMSHYPYVNCSKIKSVKKENIGKTIIVKPTLK